MSTMTSSTTEAKAAAAAVPAPPAARIPLFSADAWSPLKVELFRTLYIATSIAQIGTWIRESGGPILMGTLMQGNPHGPAMVGRVITFSNLPICLFSVFAGALADVLDRRKLLLVTQIWMAAFSALLGLLTVLHMISPGYLLFLTFVIGTGTAAAGPALQALLPELVPRKDLALAINLNSVALNVARALGPAMLIVVMAFLKGTAGIGASFFLTAASFIWAIWVLATWKREPQRAAVHGETMWDAIRAGFQYTVHSAANRAILLRVLTFIVPAVVLWAQIPPIAGKLMHLPPGASALALSEATQRIGALLFAFIGLGAIFGVLVMPNLQKRYRIDPVVNTCTALFAASLFVMAFVSNLYLALVVMVFLGINWVIIPTNFNTATQKSVPLWVKGRAISFYLTVLFGSFAIGGAVWGPLTSAYGINVSLMVGGISMAVLLILAKWFPLTLNEGLDLNAAFAGAPARPVLPDLPPPPDPAAGPLPPGIGVPGGLDVKANPTLGGPVRVSLHYHVDPTRVEDFLGVMRHVGRQRLRNGAADWKLEPVASASGGLVQYVEVMRFRSEAEYRRQPARMTRADVEAIEKAKGYHAAEGEMPGRAEILVGDAADPYAPAKAWMIDRIAAGFDRFFEETAAAFDRFALLREREKSHRKVEYRDVTVRLPVW